MKNQTSHKTQVFILIACFYEYVILHLNAAFGCVHPGCLDGFIAAGKVRESECERQVSQNNAMLAKTPLNHQFTYIFATTFCRKDGVRQELSSVMVFAQFSPNYPQKN